MDGIIENNLNLFTPISLEELANYRLQNRIDTKYICNSNQIPLILERVSPYFNVQEIDNKRIFKYESLYFDTPALKSYFDHHQGRRVRYKVRFRKYIDTGDAFLEIKKKENYIRTNKKRKEFEFTNELNSAHLDYLKKIFAIPEDGLKANLWTIFNRITLAGKHHIERITIDTGLRFKDDTQEIGLDGLSIIEVKCERAGCISPFAKVLKELHIRPMGMSKYILGNIMLKPEIKHNRFSQRIAIIKKICHDN